MDNSVGIDKQIMELVRPLTVSTITATGCIGCHINLTHFYHHLAIMEKDEKKTGMTYAEFGKRDEATHYKGFHKKLTINHRKRTEKKRFDKQCTVILQKYDEESDVMYRQNLKIFYNGVVQMTGLKSSAQGIWCLVYLISVLKRMKRDDPEIYDTDPYAPELRLRPSNFQTQLINSDFKFPFFINRIHLKDIVLHKYGVFCQYEPIDYPGLKISYIWNKRVPKQERLGLCRCHEKCIMPRGSGLEEGECKRITIIVFQSGSIIITGAHDMEQIEDAYAFILKVTRENYDNIYKSYIPSAQKEKNKDSKKEQQKMFIPKNYVNDNDP